MINVILTTLYFSAGFNINLNVRNDCNDREELVNDLYYHRVSDNNFVITYSSFCGWWKEFI